MNTGFLGSAVATVLTACGIETIVWVTLVKIWVVATVLTACGIETENKRISQIDIMAVATVLTACGIETFNELNCSSYLSVATVLTACGIETMLILNYRYISNTLQQCLPLAVLKHSFQL